MKTGEIRNEGAGEATVSHIHNEQRLTPEKHPRGHRVISDPSQPMVTALYGDFKDKKASMSSDLMPSTNDEISLTPLTSQSIKDTSLLVSIESPMVLTGSSPLPCGDVLGLHNRLQTIPLDGLPRLSSRTTRELHLDSTGSPTSSIREHVESGDETVQMNRMKGTGEGQERGQHLTVINYGYDTMTRKALGGKIDLILLSKPTLSQPRESSTKSPKQESAPKRMHPFFFAKPNNTTAIRPATPPPSIGIEESEHLRSRQNKTSITPSKLRGEVRTYATTPPKSFIPQESRISSRGNRHGAPWPWKGTSHIHSVNGEREFPSRYTVIEVPDRRKRKGNATEVPPTENILLSFMMQMSNEIPPKSGPLPSSIGSSFLRVRLPERLLVTGSTIKEKVAAELSEPLRCRLESDGLWRADKRLAHLVDLYDGIQDNLTAFDRARCQSEMWTQKYVPKCATEVLQQGKEAIALREWLQNLTISAVERSRPGRPSSKNDVSRKIKRKRKKDDMSDFIVSDGEDDAEDLHMLSNPEEFESHEQGCGKVQKKSILRLGHQNRTQTDRRLKNVILISGPNGCGKSATVYAVAKELGFEVFEINPGSRRSGKDIIEKVGDMAENHIIHPRSHPEEPLNPSLGDCATEHISSALQRDVETCRQLKMASFREAISKPGDDAGSKTSKSANSFQKKKQSSLPNTKPQVKKQQKQSLILFEEVDILFEEDKQFWATVSTLASHSKRPIIMTCNNEDLIPQDLFTFDAILRLSPPSEILAADLLLLIAAREGHIIKRDAVVNLYKSRDQDLRASITELNYWCQMAVGDEKGGLNWIYQRWPPGRDVNKDGEILRVASVGTYHSGMGWLGREVLSPSIGDFVSHDDVLLQDIWNCWGIGPDESCATCIVSTPHPDHSTLEDLRTIEQCIDAISASDIYSKIDLPDQIHPILDPTYSSLADKTSHSTTLGYPLVEVNPVIDHSQLDTRFAIATRIAAMRLSGNPSRLQFSKGIDPAPTNLLPSSTSTEEALVTTVVRHKFSGETLHPPKSSAFLDTFEPIAALSETELSHPLVSMTQFNRPIFIMASELAPYVRIIAAYELQLEARRLRLSSLLSQGCRSGKRQRTTRVSRSALEGSQRQRTRKERWFSKNLNLREVLSTAGEEWAGLGAQVGEEEASDQSMMNIDSDMMDARNDFDGEFGSI